MMSAKTLERIESVLSVVLASAAIVAVAGLSVWSLLGMYGE